MTVLQNFLVLDWVAQSIHSKLGPTEKMGIVLFKLNFAHFVLGSIEHEESAVVDQLIHRVIPSEYEYLLVACLVLNLIVRS